MPVAPLLGLPDAIVRSQSSRRLRLRPEVSKGVLAVEWKGGIAESVVPSEFPCLRIPILSSPSAPPECLGY
jgi:hypothetical protein